MGMPSITISFTEIGTTALKRGERGIIAMILKDTVAPATNPLTITTVNDIPASLKAENKKQLELALMGYVNTPLRVVAYFVTGQDYTPALNYFKTIKFDYLVVPSVETDNKTTSIVSYVKDERNSGKLIKAILPNTAGDNEGIINFATEKVMVGDEEFSTEDYCSRIAGIIAGTPLQISCTYAPLTELTDCSRLTKAQMDTAVDAGKLIVWWDGEKVKTARGVNSLVTTTNIKGSQFKKIKIVDAMDMISNDIRMNVEDNYLGKYANTYDNKCLLISAIGNYFDGLMRDNVISAYNVEIDIEANRTYLKGKGQDVTKMSEREIKEANTGSNVFLKATLSILDAIEDIVLPITI